MPNRALKVPQLLQIRLKETKEKINQTYYSNKQPSSWQAWPLVQSLD